MYDNLQDSINHLKKIDSVLYIYLFGSVARREQDEFSDIDILIIINDCSEEEFIRRKDAFAKIMSIPPSWLSVYRIGKIRQMYLCGSYFLWHIKEEGIELYSRDDTFKELLVKLPMYSNAAQDINDYNDILCDIENELDNELLDINYELSVLASLVRNTCIAISFFDQRHDFGRKTPVIYCIEKYGIEVTEDDYDQLYKYRLLQTGKCDKVEDGSGAILIRWVNIERQLLEIAERSI